MARVLYNVVFSLLMLFAWPYFAWRIWKRGPFWEGIGERFGGCDQALEGRLAALHRPVWIHAVSVGEMMLARVLIRELRVLRPGQDVVITCTTSTSRMLARRDLEDANTVVLYSAMDFFSMTRHAFERIKPSLLLLIEQELWPNQLYEAEARKVPVWIINARLSDRSWRRFKKFRRFLAPVLHKVSLVGLQNEKDTQRYIEAGFPVHALFVTGSMKSDVAELAKADQGMAEKLRSELGWAETDEVFLAGSTHPGEEELLLDVYGRLKKERPGLKFFLAPRHAERAGELASLATKRGFAAGCRSSIKPGLEVIVLDTTGELRSLYELGTVVFGGKTLVSPEGKGGQNFLEAVRVGRPVLLGPQVHNFKNLVEEYATEGGVIRVKDVADLESKLRELLEDPALREKYGRKGKLLFEAGLGVGGKVARMVEAYLKSLD